MSARQKLNAIHVWGLLIIAVGVATVSNSLLAGLVTAVILAIFSVQNGEIRFDRPPRGPPRSRRRTVREMGIAGLRGHIATL